jgi:uncharacterized protein involved in exopolysaccharide biosynthesis
MNIKLTEQQRVDLQDEIRPLLCNEIAKLRARLNRVYAERDNAHEALELNRVNYDEQLESARKGYRDLLAKYESVEDEFNDTVRTADCRYAQLERENRQLEADSFIEAEATDHWIKLYHAQSAKLYAIRRHIRYVLRGTWTEREALRHIASVITE